MKLLRVGFLALAGASLSTLAMAATTPTIKGTYVYDANTYCQPTIQVEYGKDSNGTTFVNALKLTVPEDSADAVGLAIFDPSTATLSYSATKDHGSNVLVQTSSGVQGSVISQEPEKGSGPYSNTATTVNLNGTAYTATYGKVIKGIAQYFALVGLDSSGCSKEWQFTLK
jgi:hypothetical protein